MRKAGMMIAAASMVLMMTITAAASEKMNDYGEVGFNLAEIEEAAETEGFFLPYPIGAIDDDHHVYEMDFYYVALPYEDAYRLLYDGPETELTSIPSKRSMNRHGNWSRQTLNRRRSWVLPEALHSISFLMSTQRSISPV